ncbi:Carboxylesterase type B [Penicillium angulare]|uniref:Carboxylic ester hydrolase n=1 Tax=Penicillium angulare TaxID=116970 RepID=A0A9W9JVS9_9EURO|nr:Carboxylesterase type B [Penicillium angulare]
MSTPEAVHATLDVTFKGIARDGEHVPIHQFLGIKYASIPARFEKAVPVEYSVETVVDASKYGPRCPQVDVDIRHLLRIPEDFTITPEPEDEFECLNLEITCPPVSSTSGSLPVLVWIHGGSQVVTFCSAASQVCGRMNEILTIRTNANREKKLDPKKLVADSIQAGKPFIFVSMNYRLNIFGFGNGKEKNLALDDQRIAIDWIRRNIGLFGGDPANITLSGESAGAVYTHAHLITGPPVKRGILASGSLYLSSPLPVERGDAMINTLESKVQELAQSSLKSCSALVLIQALKECNVNTMWIQADADLEDWESRPEQVDELMIGDTEYESAIWRNGIELLDGETIAAAFKQNGQWGERLRKLYQVVADRPTAAKLGALDIVNDARFTLPVEIISQKLRTACKPVYNYVVDQANPWQSSSRAHHAVDLLFLFDGLDLEFNPAANRVGQEMRQRWIAFISGQPPWAGDRRFGYGPLGECMEISEEQFSTRRRSKHCDLLRDAGIEVYMPILAALTAGRISLLN